MIRLQRIKEAQRRLGYMGMLDFFHFIRPLLLLLLVLVGLPSFAAAFSLTGNWSYRENGGDEAETVRAFQQSYSLGVGSALNYKPSHAISASASLGYSTRQSNTGSGFVKTETITPTASLSLVNDIFIASLSGNTSSTRPENSTGSNRTSWDTALISQWTVPFFPTLRFSYSEQSENNRDSDFLADPLQRSKSFTSSVGWDLYLAQLNYNYSQTRSEDLQNSSEFESQNHFARAETSGTFWDKRVSFNLAQQVSFSSQEVLSSSDTDLDATVDVPVGGTLRQTIADPNNAKVTVPNQSCTPSGEEGADCLELNPASFPLIVNPVNGEAQALYLAIDPESSINSVTISFDIVDSAGSESLQWSFYRFNFATDSWERDASFSPLPSLPVLSDDPDILQIQVFFPETDRELMLVMEDPPANTLRITDVQLFNELSSGSKTDSTRYLTNAGVGLRITDTTSASFSLTLDQNENESGGDIINQNDKLTTSGNLRWTPARYFNASFGVSEYREIPLLTEELVNRNYSLVFATRPLEAMNLSFGTQLNERFVESEKILSVMRYSITSKAQLYPDLSSSLYVTYSEGERLVDDEQTSEAVFVMENSFSTRLALNAKLYQKLRGDFSIDFSNSEREGEARQSGGIELGLRSRLSDRLAVRGSYSTTYLGQGQSDTLNLGMDMLVVDTYKTRLTLVATHIQSDTVTDNIALTGNWIINDNMTLNGRGSYRVGETNAYNFRLSLSFKI